MDVNGFRFLLDGSHQAPEELIQAHRSIPLPQLAPPLDSSADFTIILFKPKPTSTDGSAVVILPRIETNVHLDIILPSGPWNAIRLPLTKSVTSDDSPSLGYTKPLLLVIIVRGATTRQEYNCVCERCGKRTGNKTGAPSLIDFHSPSNIITPRHGMIRVHFTFSCYSRHHRREDEEYVLEVILKDASNPLEPIVARKELPYSFDVNSIKGPTNHHTYQANINISSSSNVRSKAKRPCPATTSSSAQRVTGPHVEGIERDIRQELVAGGHPDQSHVSAMSEPGPSVPHAYRPSAVPRPLVQPQHGPSGGEEGGRLEGSRGSGLSVRLEDSSFAPSAYNTADNLGEQERPLFSQAPNSSFQSHIATNTEVRLLGKVADRTVEIGTLEKYIKLLRETSEADGRKQAAALQPLIRFYNQTLAIQNEIADRFNTLVAERQKAEAAVTAEVAKQEAQIQILKEENERDVTVLTAMTNTPSWMGSGDWSEADNQVVPLFGWTLATDSAS